jgi:hypothetical protein
MSNSKQITKGQRRAIKSTRKFVSGAEKRYSDAVLRSVKRPVGSK